MSSVWRTNERVRAFASDIFPPRITAAHFGQSVNPPLVFPAHASQTIMVTAYSNAEEMQGAVLGRLQFGWLYVNMLWVDEPLRRRGIGRTLLEKLEACATIRGVCRSRLATSDFQPGHALYLQHGYEVYATIPIMPTGDGSDAHVEYLMWKHWSVQPPVTGPAARE